MEKCPFCFGKNGTMEKDRVIIENTVAYAVRSLYPVTEGHTLIISKAHERDYLLLLNREIIACHELLYHMASKLHSEDSTITGYNIGVNIGKDAGQTILHAHIHLIPRRKGDVEDPRGGVRHVIPGKGYYPDPMMTEHELEEIRKKQYDVGWEDGFQEGYKEAETELEGRIKAQYNNEFGSMLIREFDRGVEQGRKQVREEMNTAKKEES